MPNAYKNKVVYGGNTLIDLTDATATADKILSGFTAYGATGEKLVGTATGLDLDVDTTLQNNSWETISLVSQLGIGDTYWDVGDRKSVVLNGTVGTLALSNVTLYVFILDFNHPINKTTPDNNIVWGGFKTSNGKTIALADSKYGATVSDGTKRFNLNHWGGSSSPYNTNYGGWKGCDLRYDVLGGTSIRPAGYGSTPTSARYGYDATETTITTPVSNTLMAALPTDFRQALRLWLRWIDDTGNNSDTDANVAETLDAISLLTEYEVFGVRTNANTYEQKHQKQMAYYAAGNAKIRYRHDSPSTAAVWWLASPYYAGVTSFCDANASGVTYTNGSRYSYGLAPVFKT